MGFKKRYESVNGDLIAILLNTMDEKGCVFREKLVSKEEVRRITQSHRVNRKKTEQFFP
jgi:5'-3' exonuclease